MLTRTEWVWRHLLVKAFAGERRHSLTGLAAELGLAKTTVHTALDRPRAIGVVKSSRSGIRVLDPGRMLLLWAGHRELGKDILYETRTPLPPADVEKQLAHDVTLGGFAAYRAIYGRNTVADYDTVLVYGPAIGVSRRFPTRRSGASRILILEPDPILPSYGPHTPLPQTYVDLFNLPGWQAARFFIDMTRKVFAEEAA